MIKILKNIREFFHNVFTFVLKYGKYFFPGFALILAAGVVIIALNVRQEMLRREAEAEEARKLAEAQAQQELFEQSGIPLEANVDERVMQFVEDYYSCLSNGDINTLRSMCSDISESELLRLEEQSKYLTHQVNEVYSQVGPEEGTFVVYTYCYVTFDEFPEAKLPAYNGYFIKSREDGSLYIVKGELSDEESEYISKVASQDDVVELNNRINVEYNDVIIENPEILDYFVQLDLTVSTEVGEKIAQLNAQSIEEDNPETEIVQVSEDIPLENQTLYATATTNVNVRASDSTGAERLGEAKMGERYEVVEELVNGWTKIIYNDREAFIKSEFLSMIQSAEGQKTIGMLTAKDDVNVRSLPDQSSERLGALVKNDQLELVAVEDGWCTVKYDGFLAYVLSDYVEYTLFE